MGMLSRYVPCRKKAGQTPYLPPGSLRQSLGSRANLPQRGKEIGMPAWLAAFLCTATVPMRQLHRVRRISNDEDEIMELR